jgi:DNA polymerase-3 subunit gamma/tau
LEQEDKQYVVLARKYRPQNFDDLLGQDALVQTLTNAIKNNRLHHAYMLTGIRGTGKTTTARILAKALNCTGVDGSGGPTINPCGVCENCKAIAADRHIDVLELDAASRTGVDDIREILDGVRYKPTNARYKVYIIDEVHMLSKNAFNALLKTLEEPPSHVKFIFATTEIRKVPVTVLSRCQRFDLQRLTIEDLTKLFNKIINNEGWKGDEEALHIIAKAADGSARDGLSLLDQAISLGSGSVKTEVVKEMIGLADRNQTFDLFEALVSGDVNKVIKNLQEQYKNGANPYTLIQDLINITHMVAKAKIAPAFINDLSLTENEKELCKKLSPNISVAVLSKIWQMLIKGLSELNIAPSQIDAVEMILIRIAYSANMPTPAQILDDVKKNSNFSINTPKEPIAQAPKSEAVAVMAANSNNSNGAILNTTADLVKLLDDTKKVRMMYSLKNDISISEFKDGYIKMVMSDKLDMDYILNLHKVLTEATGKQWKIDSSRGVLGETIADVEKAQTENDQRDVSEYPLVRAILAEFKGAKIESLVRKVQEQMENDSEEELLFEEDII